MVQYGRLEEHPAWVMILVKVNHVLLTINSATNIVIYSYKVQLYSLVVCQRNIALFCVSSIYRYARELISMC